MSGWIGVDLDGTLAKYDGWKGFDHIGEPVPKMVKHVREWLEKGFTVKIFTARVAIEGEAKQQVIDAIHHWLKKHNLPQLEVTNVKDFGMIELYDDGCYHVVANKGEILKP